MVRTSFFRSCPLPCFVATKAGRLARTNPAFDDLAGSEDRLDMLLDGYPGEVLNKAGEAVFYPLADEYQSVSSSPRHVLVWSMGQSMVGIILAGECTQTDNILDALPLALLALDEHGRVSHWNSALERLTGVARTDMLGSDGHYKPFHRKSRQTMVDFVLSGDHVGLFDHYSRKGVHRSSLNPEAFEAEDVYRDETGASRNLLFSAAPLANEAGEITGAVETLFDISYRKHLETQLLHSENNYRTLLESMTEGVGISTSQGHIFTNSSYLKLFGYSSVAELAEINLISLLDPSSQKGFLSWSRSSQPEAFEGLAVTNTGRSFQVEISMAPVVYAGQQAFQATIRDISPKKLLEADLVKSERLNASALLASEIVHEINNPLGGIVTYGHLLKAQLKNDSELSDLITKMMKLVNRCKIIVGGLSDFGVVNSYAKQLIDINQLLNNVIDLVDGHVLLRHVRITKTLTLGLPAFLGHQAKLEQVCLNLIINAMDAMDGRGMLSLMTVLSEDGGELVISVGDNGPGIAQSEVGHIFEPFYTNKSRGRGTGLGLAISYGIIKQHGGRIEVESTPGKGTTFSVKLPLPGASSK